MGLDNGIVVMSKDKIDILSSQARNKLTDGWDELYQSYMYDIAYWRKCWQIRDDMYSVINALGLNPNNEDSGDFVLTSNAIHYFIESFMDRFSEETWGTNQETIWSWDEIKDAQIAILDRLNLLEQIAIYHENDEDFKIIFYDSW